MIKAFIIAAVSADGFIAREKDHPQSSLSWTSKEDTAFFVERTKAAGVVISGSKTFETFKRPLPGRLNIVYSTRDLHYPGVEVTSKPPLELLADLEARGYKEAALCGGASLYTLFLEAGAVDTIYLTTEPLLFGAGLSLFTKPLHAGLKLASAQNLSENVVLTEYRVQT